MPGTQGGQPKALGLLKMESELVLATLYVQRTKPSLLEEQPASTLQHRAISSAQTLFFLRQNSIVKPRLTSDSVFLSLPDFAITGTRHDAQHSKCVSYYTILQLCVWIFFPYWYLNCWKEKVFVDFCSLSQFDFYSAIKHDDCKQLEEERGHFIYSPP